MCISKVSALPGAIHPNGFFFFQAEDGIRDYKVTGVQTCALPISHPQDFHLVFHTDVGKSGLPAGQSGVAWCEWKRLDASTDLPAHSSGSSRLPMRSEERRVGKECRSRWSPYH